MCVQVNDLCSSCLLQIFKSAEELDLGCGVGGGKDNKDIFKVSKIWRRPKSLNEDKTS